VTLVIALHPLRHDRDIIEAPAGYSVGELVDFARARQQYRLRTRIAASINGEAVGSEHWRYVRPRPGTTVVLRGVAAGPGNDTLKAILGIAIAAGALVLAPIIAPLIVGAGASAAVLAGATALIGAGISIGGQLALNALFPIAPPMLGDGTGTSTTYSISGGQNTANLYGVVPVNLGKNRIYPNLAAKWYTDNVGSDQYLIGIITGGYGAQDISAIKIGETPIEQFADVQLEVRQGYAGDAPITLYPSEVLQDDLSIDITAAAGAQIRTTDTNIEAVSLDFVAPSGVGSVGSDGSVKTYTVTIRVEYSLAAANAWSQLGIVTFSGRSRDTIRQGIKATLPKGQYDIRVTKTSGDANSDQVQEQVVWTALRGFRNEAPIAFSKPLAKIAIRIRATSQLNGSINSLNYISQSKVKSWNGTEWLDDTISNNPADLFRYVLQCAANALPVADAGIDLETLQEWAEYCTAQGFTFDMQRDTAVSVYDTLVAIASGGRAKVVFPDGRWSVYWDDQDAPIVQYFTTRNSWGFKGEPTFALLPHALRFRFINQDVGYAEDERTVYEDGYDETNATRFEMLEMPGQVNPRNVWRHGRFHQAQAKLRPEIYSLNSDIEHIVCTQGSRVGVTYDVPEWGGSSARVKSIVGQVVTLDDPVTMVADTAYSIGFRLSDDQALIRSVVTDDGEQYVVTLDGDGDLPEVGDLAWFGVTGQESVILRVRSVTPDADLSALLTFVDDAPAISQADQGAIPPFDSKITVPIDPHTAAPINLVLREALEGVNGDISSGVVMTWDVMAGEYPVSFETQYQDVDGDQLWRPNNTVLVPALTDTVHSLAVGKWSFRVRAIFADGSASGWTQATLVLTGLAGVTLGDVTDLRFTYIDKTAAITWSDVASAWPVIYEIRSGDSWEGALKIGEQAHPPFTTFGDGTYWFAAKIQPAPGVVKYSEHPAQILIAGSVLVENVVAEFDEAGTGWTGTVTGPGEISGADFVTTGSGDIAYYEIPTAHAVAVGYSRATRLNASIKATGVPTAADFLGDPDFLNNPDIFAGASARQVDAWVEVASSTGGADNDAFAPTDAFAETDVFLAGSSFGPWVRFAPGVYVGSRFKLRVALRTNDAAVQGVVTEFSWSVDVPDRVDHVIDHPLADAGETFTFAPDATGVATPFNGGPNKQDTPLVLVNVIDGSAGDEVLITAKTLTEVTIQIVNGGVRVARTINAFFQGW
jgi:hypothetical protein